MKPGTPYFKGERLREAREARGLTGVALSELLGVTRQTVSQYEHNKITPAPKLMESMAMILRMPLDYFSFDARWVTPRQRFMRSMATTSVGARLRADRRYDWLVSLGRYLEGFLKFPVTNLPDIPTPRHPEDISDEFIDEAAEAVRRHWKLGEGPISNIAWLLENNGVVVGQCRLFAEKLDAFSDWDDERGSRPYFVLGLDKRTAVRSRFDAAHELGHAILHRHVDRSRIFKKGEEGLFHAVEAQANRFAGAFMLPAESFSSDFVIPTLDAMVTLKAKWKASIAMMTIRSGQLGLLSEDQVRFFYINIGRRKWREKEPLDNTLEPEQPRLLKRSLELLIDKRVQTRDQILGALHVPAADIEEIANLKPGFLSEPPDIVNLREQADPQRVVEFRPPNKTVID